jgi:uncharacterized protein YyaL (SSP411 family)
LESSPYLLQHADNPVDWHPWGPEAFDLARQQDKPILLSVGYAACHWCHVMAHESFENQETARIMNEHFINIKVDREERPDVDRIYMSAVVAMTGQGGWPMTVALTSEGEPFFGGTYFPPAARHGLPSFQQVLMSLAEAWRENRNGALDSASRITDYLTESMKMERGDGQLDESVLDKAYLGIKGSFDEQFGGFGQAPKFPQPMTLEFLIRYFLRTENGDALHMVEHSLQKMAQGGIFDQIGGGFARYSTDKFWLVPHFEKMLYDNALLARVYLHAWRITGRSQYRRVVEDTLDWLLAEMQDAEGGFYSSLDADSEGIEGKYYVWTAEEIRESLGVDAELFIEYFGVSKHGNWEGTNILSLSGDLPQIDEASEELDRRIRKARSALAKIRAERIRPSLDDKVLTSWNGLVLSAFAEAGSAFDNPVYTDAAVRNAKFIHQNLRQDDGRLYRTWKQGHGAKIDGYLEDYAFLADGLLALYQNTFDIRWFTWSRELADIMIDDFHDVGNVGFFDTAVNQSDLISRPRETQDNAIPSGNATAVSVLLQLHLYTGLGSYADISTAAISSMQPSMGRYPLGFGQWLGGAVLAMSEPLEVAIVGEIDAEDTQRLIDVVFSQYRPNSVIAVGEPNAAIPLLEGRLMLDGRATAYVCRRFACKLPVDNADDLEEQLNRMTGSSN